MAHVAISPSLASPPWLLDSGSSHYITANLNNLNLHAPNDGLDDVVIGDGTGLSITHSGSTYLSIPSRSFTLQNVLCVPNMKRNLISISQFFKTNKTLVEFLPSSFHVKDLQMGAILIHSHTKDDVFEWLTKPSTSIIVFSSVIASSYDWHHWLGHPSKPILRHLVSHYKLHTVSALSSFHCKDCFCNKSHKLPFSQSTIVSSIPPQIIFSNVWISHIQSIDNFKYYVVFVAHFTHYIWFDPLKCKSDVSFIFPHFKSLVENFFKRKIITLYSDNEGEYTGLSTFLATHGISHHTSSPHTEEHNDFSERRHRHLSTVTLQFGTSLSSFSSPFLMVICISHGCISHYSSPYTYTTDVLSISQALRVSSQLFQTPCLWLSVLSMASTLLGAETRSSFRPLCLPWLLTYPKCLHL